jgi:acetolactate synthase-1/2/3 large subunit
MDSIPIIAITGQVPQAMIGKGGFQETDFFGMTLPVVKHSYLITDIHEIPRIVKEAFQIATTGRPGPVVIDFPKNIQQQKAQPVWPTEVHLRGYVPSTQADDIALNEIIGLIEKSERPVLYCGGGIISGNASEELRQFAQATQIPVTTTIMGVGAFPESHPLSLRWLGMHGTAYANWAVNGEFQYRERLTDPLVKLKEGADLLLAFGVRFDDRVTGKVDKFCEGGTIVHIDIDASEHNKNKSVQLAVQSDIRYALRRLNEMLAKRPITKRFDGWHQQIAEWKARAPLEYRVTEEVMKSQHMRDHLEGKSSEVILPQMAIDLLY